MTIDTWVRAGVVYIQPNGHLTLESEQQFRELLRHHLETGRTRFVLDLAKVPAVDTCGLGAMAQGCISARRRGGDFKLMNVGERVRHVLTTTRLLQVFEMTELDAKAGLPDAPQHAGAGKPQSMDLWAGRWRLNTSKSAYDPGPAPKIATLATLEIVHGLLRVTSEGINGQGEPTQSVTFVRFDGTEPPVVSTDQEQSVTRAYTYMDEHTCEWVTKVGGQVTTRTRASLAPDCRVQTLTTTGTNAQGQRVRNVLVFEKE